jgi:ferrous iron transport protein A
MTVADLEYGQIARIDSLSENHVPLKLMEMGCLPGNLVELVQLAPFRDPMYLNINGSHLAIRKDVAELIEIELQE